MTYYMRTFFKTIPRLAIVLAGDGILKKLSLCVRLWCFVLGHKIALSKGDIKFNFCFKGTTFVLYLRHPMDIGVLREIFIDEEYDWCPVENPKVIVDLGAHYGDTTLYYHIRFPEALILAVEPASDNFERLEKNTKDIKNVIAVHAAVGSENGSCSISMTDSSLARSTVFQKQGVITQEVIQYTLPELLRKYEIVQADLIKFDIEGAEFATFSVSGVNSIGKCFIGEVHTDLVPGSALESFESLFSGAMVSSVPIAGKGRFLTKIHFL